MATAKLFQYAILWHPTEKQVKEEGLKSKVLTELTTILAQDQSTASLSAVMQVPKELQNELDQIEVVIRPF